MKAIEERQKDANADEERTNLSTEGKFGGHGQDTESSSRPAVKSDKDGQERARKGLGKRLRLGYKLRNTRETGIGLNKRHSLGDRLELTNMLRSSQHN